ncbi:hypothetical protein [Thermococcus henrietii]|uniref:hypothetical protein n=1 Tax=Thermococcus henrietii TaxID=2016361 RepID=UPI000C070CA0|nr:hypothetical protein [Thermococcus henrietii]
MVRSGGLVESRIREGSREELEECVKKRYRHKMFKHWEVLVHAMLEMLREGMLPEEMIEEFQRDKEMEVEIKDTKTMYHYISDILDMYSEIKEEFYEALRKRIENRELPKNKTAFWKGRFLEDLVYESLEEMLEEHIERGKDIIVLPIYKIRTRPGTDEKERRGRKSDADKIADVLVIDWSSRTLIVIELKNFWEHYSGQYDVEEQARKLPATVSDEGLDIILSRVKSGRIPGRKRRKLSRNLIKTGWEILCGKREAEIQYQMHVEALKHLSGFRKVYVWLHAGEQVDMLEVKLDEFEKKYGIEILRVFVNKPLYYTPENKRFMKQIIQEILYVVYSDEGRRIKTLEIDSKGVLVVDRDQNVLGFQPFEMWDGIETTEPEVESAM